MKYIRIRNILTTFIFLFVFHQSYSQPVNSTTEDSIYYDNKPIPVEIQNEPDYDEGNTTQQNNETDYCLQGGFHCHNGHQCIDEQDTCDGITQCSDGSDEGDEICGSNSTTTRSTIIISKEVTSTFTESDEIEPYETSGSDVSQTSKTTAKSTTEKNPTTTENIPTTNETTDVPVYDSTIAVEMNKSSHYNWLHLIITFCVVAVSVFVLSIIVMVFLYKGIFKKTGEYNVS